MSEYQHIFFDLDRTLWDFDVNSREALLEIIDECKLKELGVEDADAFIGVYQEVNEHYWGLYREQQIDKATLRWIRFDQTLEKYGVRDRTLALQLADRYIEVSPQKTALLPGTIDVLNHLANRYRLHIITNGFEEVQHIKISRSGLTHYFDVVVTSESAGCKKPGREIFEHACRNSGAEVAVSLMIGDDLETDIKGAQNAGMDHVFFNPKKNKHDFEVTHEISALAELKSLL